MNRSVSTAVAAAGAADIGVVVAFVLLGRTTHQEGNAIADAARTAAPFLAGLGIGWAATRARHRPSSPAVGAGIALITVSVGMVLRRLVFDDGTAASFIVVATGVIALGLVGWRAIVAGLQRRGGPGPAGSESGAVEGQGRR